MRIRGVFILILSSIMAFAIFHPSYGQEGRGDGRVKGVVVDDNGLPIPGVKILMEAASYDFKLETVSDKKGKWVLINFSKDNFKLTYSKEGYTTIVMQVSLSGANRNPDQDIVLKRITQLQLDQELPVGERQNVETAMKLFDEKNYAAALELFKAFVDAHSTIYMARLNLGKTYQKLNQPEAARTEYNKVLEGLQKEADGDKIKEKSSNVYILIADSYMDQSLYDEATANYKKALEIYPATDPAVPFNIAEVMFTAGKVDEAIQYYQEAIRLDPKSGFYHLKLGYAYLNKGDIASAVKRFETFLEMSPNDPQAEPIKNIILTLKKQQPPSSAS